MSELSSATNSYLSVKPQLRELNKYRNQLDKWVSRYLGLNGVGNLLDIEATPPDTNGFAGETFFIDVTVHPEVPPQRYVLKRKPTQHIYFPDHDFTTEAKIQDVLSRSGAVPIARFIAFEPDERVIGSPFYVLAFVDGQATPDSTGYYLESWVSRLPANEQRAICEQGLRSLADLHALDIDAVGAEFLRGGRTPAQQVRENLAHWHRFNEASWAKS